MLAMGPQPDGAHDPQPLRNVRLVLLTLLANFVLVPLLAYLVLLIIPLEGATGRSALDYTRPVQPVRPSCPS